MTGPRKGSGIPDMGDTDAFVPPDWCKTFILLQDGDSDAEATRNKLLSGGRRAAATHGTDAYIASAADGQDFNDMLRAGGKADIRAALEKAERVPPIPSLDPPSPPSYISEAPPPGPLSDDGLPPEAEAVNFRLNDQGNARRLALYFGVDLMYVPAVAWHVWSGTHWQEDRFTLAVRDYVHRLPDRIAAEKAYLPNLLQPWQLEQLQKAEELERELEALEERLDAETGGNVKSIDSGDGGEKTKVRVTRIKRKLDAVKAIRKELSTLKGKHTTWERDTGNSTRITNALKEAQVLRRYDHEQIDQELLALNTKSGTLRFTRWPDDETPSAYTLEPHTRLPAITKCCAAAYDPAAVCPTWETFLERVQPNPDYRAFLQRWVGYCATGLVGEHKMVFMYGGGRNGKSVFADTIAEILGNYAATAEIESLVGDNRRNAEAATPDLIKIAGARFVRASEPEQGQKLREAQIKRLTGGEPISVRKLHGEFYDIRPAFKITVSGNHKPDVRGVDDGIWERLILVHWDVKIPKEERDKALGEKLLRERDGILNWIVTGVERYLEFGLAVPEEIQKATDEYKAENNPFAEFLATCCEFRGPGDFTRSRELVDGFNFWLVESGGSAWTERTVLVRLKEMSKRYVDPKTGNIMEEKKRSVKGYAGVRLTDEFRARFEKAAPGDWVKDEGDFKF